MDTDKLNRSSDSGGSEYDPDKDFDNLLAGESVVTPNIGHRKIRTYHANLMSVSELPEPDAQQTEAEQPAAYNDMTERTPAETDSTVITTEKVAVSSLEPGDLLHVVFPCPHLQVVHNERRGGLIKARRRSKVTLTDKNDMSKSFYLSPERMVNRVTNPNIKVGTWQYNFGGPGDLTVYLAAWQREDALWYRTLSPLAAPFLKLWQALLDLPCRVYPLRLSGGFIGVMVCIIAAAVTLASQTDPQFSVAISIAGAFIAERSWEAWKVRIRHKIAKGVSLRVRYRLGSESTTRYGVLRLETVGAVIIDGTPGQTWHSTGMVLYKRKQIVGRCNFANDLRGDPRYTLTEIAEQIRTKLHNGADHPVMATSFECILDGKTQIGIEIAPIKRYLSFRDKGDSTKRCHIMLQHYQSRVLADVLEAMDVRGRRTTEHDPEIPG